MDFTGTPLARAAAATSAELRAASGLSANGAGCR
jgi:hypothetical protein